MYGRGRVVGGIVLLIGLVLGALAIGALAYNTGVADGIAQGASEGLLGGEVGKISPYFHGARGFGHYGPGSFLLSCLVVPFLFFLFFGAMRLIFSPWGMHRRHGGWGWKGGEERRQRFEEMATEWHRKAHAADEEKTEEDKV